MPAFVGSAWMQPKTPADRAPIPLTSLIFGYGPMLPLVVAAAAVWIMPPPWPELAVRLATIWAAAILVFVAGVRRGYGFGAPGASTAVAIGTMLVYFVPGSLALVLQMAGRSAMALGLLILGFALVAIGDRRAAVAGQAPAHFARLRIPQMAIGIAAMIVTLCAIP